MADMNKRDSSEGSPGSRNRDQYTQLARWLQELLAAPPGQARTEAGSMHEGETRIEENYHPQFYSQLPDFVMALLKNDSQATLRYAPLIYHLIGCNTCHTAYLEIYDAMRAATQPDIPSIEVDVDEETHSMATTPARMVEYITELLINQAEAVLRQARHDHDDNDAWARSLLQQAIQISKHIMQGSMRQHALRKLVDVATMCDDTSDTAEQGPVSHSYSSLSGAGNGSRHARTSRGSGTLQRPESQQTIYLQSGTLTGVITQHEQILELHLVDLEKDLRGHYVYISVLLGSLLEPVRWYGGNPRAIRSQVPVDEHGSLRMSLGETDLHLSKAEDRYLLETMFKKLDVRLTD
jgi:hypothetical protein